MCGIAGVFRRDGAPIAGIEVVGDTLSGALAHRGPDGQGVWRSPRHDVLLVHRRLAIIDPSPRGAQPMQTRDGRFVMTFNGEVYNYKALRAELQARGERFETDSDTEVLLRLVVVDGPAALARVRGMFAFAMWDCAERSMCVARDRFGIKPLYVAASGTSIAFASELGALRAAGFVSPEPSAAAVLAFLKWGSVPPPLAWNRGAEAVESGTWIEWRSGEPARRGRFADAREPYVTTDARLRADDFSAAVASAVRDSVDAHLVADVPVGVFLSGGIDSGAIVSTAQGRLQTFTVVFDDHTSEAARARRVAEAFGTEHREIQVDGAAVARDLGAVLSRLDQPSIDAINSFYVARAVASTGIKAVLSGTGGDELFGGYPSFRRLPRALRARGAAGPLWPAATAAGRAVLPSRLQSRWRQFTDAPSTIEAAYRTQRGFFMDRDIDDLAGPALRGGRTRADAEAELAAAEETLLAAAGPERPVASVARLETRVYMQSQLLRDLDVMSMAHGLEVRVPFVDHVLAGAVWPELGNHPALLAGKQLLHGTLERPLPDAVVTHPKQGFTLPFARWMRGELAGIVQDGMSQLVEEGWLTPAAPRRVWTGWTAGTVHWSQPWGLAVLGAFLRSSRETLAMPTP